MGFGAAASLTRGSVTADSTLRIFNSRARVRGDWDRGRGGARVAAVRAEAAVHDADVDGGDPGDQDGAVRRRAAAAAQQAGAHQALQPLRKRRQGV